MKLDAKKRIIVPIKKYVPVIKLKKRLKTKKTKRAMLNNEQKLIMSFLLFRFSDYYTLHFGFRQQKNQHRSGKTGVETDIALFADFKFVTNAPDRLEIPLVADALELFAKALDVHINRAGITDIFIPPDMVKKLFPGENLIGRCRKKI